MFLQPLQQIVKSLTTIATTNISAASRLEKRQVFGFLDEQQAVIAARIKEMQQVVAGNMAATAAQVKQLTVLAAQLQPLGQKALVNLKNLKSTYKSAEYIASQNDLTAKITVLQHQIETRFTPKLQIMQEIQRVNAASLLISMHNLLGRVKRSNATAFKNYNEAVANRKDIYKQLNTLITDSRKVIVGTEDELARIRKTWDAADIALAELSKKLKALPKVSDAQKTDMDSSAEQINGVYRKQLSNLKSKQTPAIIRLNNKNLDKTINAFHSSIEKINDLNGKMKEAKTLSASLVKKANSLHD
jgi:hypothetical protein